jgi:hypothetical protein
MAFVHRGIAHMCSVITSAAVPTGVGSTLGNKGGVGVYFKVANTRILIVNAHLAAHQTAEKRRNAEFNRINKMIPFLLEKKHPAVAKSTVQPSTPKMPPTAPKSTTSSETATATETAAVASTPNETPQEEVTAAATTSATAAIATVAEGTTGTQDVGAGGVRMAGGGTDCDDALAQAMAILNDADQPQDDNAAANQITDMEGNIQSVQFVEENDIAGLLKMEKKLSRAVFSNPNAKSGAEEVDGGASKQAGDEGASADPAAAARAAAAALQGADADDAEEGDNTEGAVIQNDLTSNTLGGGDNDATPLTDNDHSRGAATFEASAQGAGAGTASTTMNPNGIASSFQAGVDAAELQTSTNNAADMDGEAILDVPISSEKTLENTADLVVFMGDLNYRIKGNRYM